MVPWRKTSLRPSATTAVGQIGTETTINSGDMAGILMIAVQALEKRTAELKQKEAQIAVLESKVEELKAKHAYFETVAARLEALELRQHQSDADNRGEVVTIQPAEQTNEESMSVGKNRILKTPTYLSVFRLLLY